MRTRIGRGTALAVATAGLLLGAGSVWAVNIEIEGATIPPQGMGEIQVSVDPETDAPVATLNDIKFPPDREVVVTSQTASGTLKTAISDTDTVIELQEGDADTFPSFGIVTIDTEEISYSAIGVCFPVADPAVSCKSNADCGTGTCNGDALLVAARAEPPGATSHAVGANVTVPVGPACAATSDITNLNKDVVFSFQPNGCNPAEDCVAGGDPPCCVGIRAIVIALDNLDEITSPTSIYRCTVKTDQDDGTFPLVCPEVGVACTSNDQCETTETCNTTAGVCVPNPPFQPAQSGDSPLTEGQVGNLPTTCTGADVIVSEVTPCVGDCGAPLGTVSLGEVQRAFRGFLTQDPSLCTAADANGMGGISLGEVQQSFRNFLAGACPAG